MDADRRTIISGGIAIRAILLGDRDVAEAVGEEGIYPVDSRASERLPRIVYRCTGLERTEVKGRRGNDTATFDLWIYAADYDAAIELAETVDGVLGGFRGGQGAGIPVRCSFLEDTEDNITDNGIYAKRLTYSVKI